jgi:hypothetical protein
MNDDATADASTPGGGAARDLRRYRRPNLTVYGSLERLTLNSPSKNMRDSFFVNTRT